MIFFITLFRYFTIVLFFTLHFFSFSQGMQTRERAHCARSVFPFIKKKKKKKNCPKCNKGGKCVYNLHSKITTYCILILHLNRFGYNISARKKQNYVDFPPRQLSLGEHALSGANLASYDLCAVSNHHGTMNGGHCTSYCKQPQEKFGTSVTIKPSPNYEHQ